MIDFSKVYLGSSSKGKLAEYNSFGLSLSQKEIPDYPEVLGTEQEVITYKALQMGEKVLVEDTSLQVEGEAVGVNVKWLIKELKTNPKYEGRAAIWTVWLGLLYEQNLYLVKAEIEGHLSAKNSSDPAFGFDAIFIPKGTNYTLAQLNALGLKQQYSARKAAITDMLSQKYTVVIPVNQIPPWTGAYQK